MEIIRAFIAIDVGKTIRSNLAQLQQQLKVGGADIRWNRPKTMHLTLAFIGNTPADRIEVLGTILDRDLRGVNPFTMTARGIGMFCRRKRPGVLWAGIDENPALLELRERIVAAVDDAEIAFDNPRFRPHLTLGRFKSAADAAPLIKLLENERERFLGEVRVESVELLKSELKPDGAEHTCLHRTSFT